jgi:hypothetical protein
MELNKSGSNFCTIETNDTPRLEWQQDLAPHCYRSERGMARSQTEQILRISNCRILVKMD